jgi:hypothetical protein
MPAKTHGHTRGKVFTRTYSIWASMLARCSTPSATGYANYGGRGISVCEKWRKFEGFLEDMGECPDGLSIDRLDTNGNYEPGNCRWASDAEQARNTTRTVYVHVAGEKKVARDVAAANGIHIATFKKRLYVYGWPVEQACGVSPRIKSV